MDISAQYANDLQQKFGHTYDFSVEYGKKYDRIVQRFKSTTMRGGSVHAFIERSTGKLAKPAGWKAPARYVGGILASKYDLSDPTEYAIAVHESDPYGSYLYAN